MKAIWNGAVIAESDQTRVVERNHYFPPESVNRQYLEESAHHTTCFWKGEASYFHLVVDGQRNDDAAWTYPEASVKAKPIEGFIAFWRGVTIED